MVLSALGLSLIFISVACFTTVLVHAFRRSIGTGFIVLCLPLYALYYGFSQFTHPRKGLLLAGWIGTLVPGVIFQVVGVSLAAQS